MPYTVCRASDVPPGDLAVITMGGQSRLGIAVALPQQRRMLLLPRAIPDPSSDFGLFRTDTAPNMKALALGRNYFFDFDPMTAALQDNDIKEVNGCLLVSEARLVMVGMEGTRHEEVMACVDIRKGSLVSTPERRLAAGFASWRLMLHPQIEGEVPRELLRWQAV